MRSLFRQNTFPRRKKKSIKLIHQRIAFEIISYSYEETSEQEGILMDSLALGLVKLYCM
jgi:hypothetical protein